MTTNLQPPRRLCVSRVQASAWMGLSGYGSSQGKAHGSGVACAWKGHLTFRQSPGPDNGPCTQVHVETSVCARVYVCVCMHACACVCVHVCVYVRPPHRPPGHSRALPLKTQASSKGTPGPIPSWKARVSETPPAVLSHLRSGSKRSFQALVSALGSLLRKIPMRRSSWNGLASADIPGEAGSRVLSSTGRGRSSVPRLGSSPSRSHTLSAASKVFTARSLLSNGCISQGRQTDLASRQVPSLRGVPGAAGNSEPPCVLLEVATPGRVRRCTPES